MEQTPHRDLFDRVARLIATHSGTSRQTIDEETTLKSDLGLDSLELFELMFRLETTFGVDIDESDQLIADSTHDVSVGQLVELIKNERMRALFKHEARAT